MKKFDYYFKFDSGKFDTKIYRDLYLYLVKPYGLKVKPDINKNMIIEGELYDIDDVLMVSSTIYNIVYSSPISVFEKVNLSNPLKSKLESNLEFFLLDFEKINKFEELGTYSKLDKLLRIFQNGNYNIIKNQQNKESYLVSGFDLVEDEEIIKIFLENSNLKGLKYIDLLNDKTNIKKKVNKINEFFPKLENTYYKVLE